MTTVNEEAGKKLKITLVRSVNKCLKAHKQCVKGLGLRRLGSSVTVVGTEPVLGMIFAVRYLLRVEEI